MLTKAKQYTHFSIDGNYALFSYKIRREDSSKREKIRSTDYFSHVSRIMNEELVRFFYPQKKTSKGYKTLYHVHLEGTFTLSKTTEIFPTNTSHISGNFEL